MNEKNYYVLTDYRDWADEFDVQFFELITGDDYQKYEMAKKVFGSYYGLYCFGTNEYYDEFDFLNFNAKPITKEQYEFLQSLKIKGNDIVQSFFVILSDACEYAGIKDDIYNETLEEFRDTCIKLKNFRENEEE